MPFSINAIYTWYRNALRHPQYRWWIILGTFAYLLSPLDISPDLFPIFGQIDDVALVTLLFAELSQMLVAWVKARQNIDSTSSNPQSEAGETVDVDAVSMDE